MKILHENTIIPSSTYEYILKHFQYPNYNNVPSDVLYHNTHLEYVDSIAHNGILVSKAKQLEYSGNMTWATTLPNQKGYGGCTVAFTLDGLEDRYDYEQVNRQEFCIYKDIPAKNILFIDLPVIDGNGIGLERLSDIPELIDEFGLDKIRKVFSRYSDEEYIPLDEILPYINKSNIHESYITEMKLSQAQKLVTKDIEDMSLEELQQYRVQLLDAIRYSTGEFGDEESYRNGFYIPYVSAGSSKGFVPKDKFLTTNLRYKLDEVDKKLQSIYNADKYEVLDYDESIDEYVVVASFPTKREANKFIKNDVNGTMKIRKI